MVLCNLTKWLLLGLVSSVEEEDFIVKLQSGEFSCYLCGYVSSEKQRIQYHYESKHGHVCNLTLQDEWQINLHTFDQGRWGHSWKKCKVFLAAQGLPEIISVNAYVGLLSLNCNLTIDHIVSNFSVIPHKTNTGSERKVQYLNSSQRTCPAPA